MGELDHHIFPGWNTLLVGQLHYHQLERSKSCAQTGPMGALDTEKSLRYRDLFEHWHTPFYIANLCMFLYGPLQKQKDRFLAGEVNISRRKTWNSEKTSYCQCVYRAVWQIFDASFPIFSWLNPPWCYGRRHCTPWRPGHSSGVVHAASGSADKIACTLW